MPDYPSLMSRFNAYNKKVPKSGSLSSFLEDDDMKQARAYADKPLNRFRQFLELDESPEAVKLKQTFNISDDLSEIKRIKQETKAANDKIASYKTSSFLPKSPLDIKGVESDTKPNSIKKFKSGGDFSGLASVASGADGLAPLVQTKYDPKLVASNPELAKRIEATNNRNKVQAPIESAVMTLGPYGALIGGAFKAGRLGGQAMQKVGTDEYGRNKGTLGGLVAGAGSGMDVVGGFLEGFNTKGKGTGEKVLDMIGTGTGLNTITGAINQLTFRKKRLQKRGDELERLKQEEGMRNMNNLSNSVYQNFESYKPGVYGKKGLKISKFLKK